MITQPYTDKICNIHAAAIHLATQYKGGMATLRLASKDAVYLEFLHINKQQWYLNSILLIETKSQLFYTIKVETTPVGKPTMEIILPDVEKEVIEFLNREV